MRTVSAAASRVRRAGGRLGLGLVIGAGAVLLGSSAASAHIDVQGDDAKQGGYGVLTFRVPNESPTASTTKVALALPKDTPIVSASPRSMIGWKAVVTTAALPKPLKTDDGEFTTYATAIVWTATSDDAAVQPGEFQEFSISAGPLPEQAEVALPVRQTYSDGEVVNWNEVATGSAEPENAAPVLQLAAAGAGDHSSGGAGADTAAEPAAVTQDAPGLGVGIAGIALAAIALVVAVVSLLRRRSTGESR